ncbi:MAG: TRAP transporter fused permease subunit [Desulfurococcales archaeon]|nr:TRAP transporter fused permease subunit [Desulfurococcales archaeon]
MSREEQTIEELNPFKIVQMRARKGLPWIVAFGLAMFVAFLEIFYQMNFFMTLAQFLENIGLKDLAASYKQTLYISSRSVMGLIMGGLVATGFIVFPARRPDLRLEGEELRKYMEKYVKRVPWYDVVLAALAIIVFAYHAYLGPYVEANEGELPPGSENYAILATIIGFTLVYELTRRTVGPWLTLVVTAFLLYYLNYWHEIGLNLKGVLLSWSKDMFFSNYGLFNIPFQVMAAYVFAFLFFGTFLERIGIGQYITRLMLGIFGNRPGGPAKVAIVSSGLMGMLSGSSVANVFTTGVFTIPMMKRSGFPPEVAGAIEASASTGGQIMPPIMGAAAFIMASYLGRPYSDIVIAAFLPAFIYFLSLYFQIDLEAKRRNLKGLPPEMLPDTRKLARKIYLLAPLVAITLLLVIRLPPQHSVVASLSIAFIAAIWALEDISLNAKISYTVSLILIAAIAWLAGMSLLSAIYFTGIAFLFLSGLLIFVKSLREFGWVLFDSIEQAVRNSIPVFMAAALAGVVQGSLTLTGLVSVFGEKLIAVAHGNIYLLLILAGLLSIVVGMGVPTTANYVITSLLSASAIVTAAVSTLGLPEAAAKLGAHMFVFYYGILADLTPPVALAAFAGATVAKADFWKTAVNATRFGFAKYVLPFVFAVNPALLVLTVIEGYMSWESFAWSLITVTAVLVAASAAFAGYFGGRIDSKWVRAVLAILGILAVSGNPYLVFTALIVSAAVYVAARKGLLAA